MLYANDAHCRISLVCVYVVCFQHLVAAQIHIAPFSPKVIVHRVHGSQSGNNFGLSVWGNPPLHHLPYGILCLLSHLVCCSYHKIAQHLIAFSGRNDFIICAVPENSLSGIKHFISSSFPQWGQLQPHIVSARVCPPFQRCPHSEQVIVPPFVR